MNLIFIYFKIQKNQPVFLLFSSLSTFFKSEAGHKNTLGKALLLFNACDGWVLCYFNLFTSLRGQIFWRNNIWVSILAVLILTNQGQIKWVGGKMSGSRGWKKEKGNLPHSSFFFTLWMRQGDELIRVLNRYKIWSEGGHFSHLFSNMRIDEVKVLEKHLVLIKCSWCHKQTKMSSLTHTLHNLTLQENFPYIMPYPKRAHPTSYIISYMCTSFS